MFVFGAIGRGVGGNAGARVPGPDRGWRSMTRGAEVAREAWERVGRRSRWPSARGAGAAAQEPTPRLPSSLSLSLPLRHPRLAPNHAHAGACAVARRNGRKRRARNETSGDPPPAARADGAKNGRPPRTPHHSLPRLRCAPSNPRSGVAGAPARCARRGRRATARPAVWSAAAAPRIEGRPIAAPRPPRPPTTRARVGPTRARGHKQTNHTL